MLQTPRANLGSAARWLQSTYSIRFNRRHRRSGHLYQGRFKAHLVEEDAYARELLKHIHLATSACGGQRMTKVAAACGYRDGSGVHRVVKRLDGNSTPESRPVQAIEGLGPRCVKWQELNHDPHDRKLLSHRSIFETPHRWS